MKRDEVVERFSEPAAKSPLVKLEEETITFCNPLKREPDGLPRSIGEIVILDSEPHAGVYTVVGATVSLDHDHTQFVTYEHKKLGEPMT